MTVLSSPPNDHGPHNLVYAAADTATGKQLAQVFRPEHILRVAGSGDTALALLSEQPAAALLADEILADMSGMELLRKARLLSPNTLRVWIAGPERAHLLESAAAQGVVEEFISSPYTSWHARWTVRKVLESRRLAAEYNALQRRFRETLRGALSALTDAIDAKDPGTYGHSYRVMQYAMAIARRMGLGEADLADLEMAALLHDIGKIGIPEAILTKPAALTEEEYAIIKTHPARGQMMLWRVPELERVLPLVRHHHEQFDGKGYPDGLAGEQIPLLARILTLTDAYDAITGRRPYGEPLSHDEAMKQVERFSGARFDPQLVKVFREMRQMADVRRVVESAPDLPAFSPVVKRALQILVQPEPNLGELGKVLGSDPGLMAKIFRLVNSVSMALPRKITDMREALTFIGIHELYRMLVALAARPMLGYVEGYFLWWHSLVCAFCAEALARRVSGIAPSDAFMAGLFHDIGKVLLLKHFTPAYKRVLQLVSEGSTSQTAELLVFGVDHAEIGGWLLEKWDMPLSLCNAVRSHHSFDLAAHPMAHLLALANMLAHLFEGEEAPQASYLGLMGHFNLDLSELEVFRTQVQAQTMSLRERLSALL